ncbi:hypothetical protein PS2_032761 [Malus domestica]
MEPLRGKAGGGAGFTMGVLGLRYQRKKLWFRFSDERAQRVLLGYDYCKERGRKRQKRTKERLKKTGN